MDGSQSLSMLSRRKTNRVRGPRPCSWVSSSSDSSSSEPRDTWPWAIARQNLSRGSTLRSTTSITSLDSTTSSSPSSSPAQTLNILAGYSEKPRCRHARKQKPAGPRPPRNSSCFDGRPGLLINTSLPAIPQLPREIPPTTPIESAVLPKSPQIPPLSINSPTNFPLDWDLIFEILGCSEENLDGT